MKNILLFSWNFILLGLVVVGVEYYNQNPRIFIYAFLLSYTMKLLTIEGILLIYEERCLPFAKPLLPYISKNPPPGAVSNPFIEETSKKPIKLPGYLLLMVGAFIFFILLLHVNKHHELDFKWRNFFIEMGWGCLLGFVWWIGDILSKTIIIDTTAPREINYGYNNREVVILAFAVLLGALAIMIFQMRGKNPTPWVIYGPLLVIKQMYDMRREKSKSDCQIKRWGFILQKLIYISSGQTLDHLLTLVQPSRRSFCCLRSFPCLLSIPPLSK